MKKIVLFLSFFTLLISCSEEKQNLDSQEEKSIYKNSIVPTFTVENNVYTFDYVKDQDFDSGYFCYANLYLNNSKFQELAGNFLNNYNLSKVFEMRFFGESKDICNGHNISKDNIKSLLVYYANSNGEAYMDFIKLSNGYKESYQISDVYATTSKYFLYEKTGIVSHPSIISVRNGDFDISGLIFDDEADMISFSVIPPIDDTYIHPGIDDGSANPDCPLNCVPGDEPECNSLDNCTEICFAKSVTKELYLTNNYQNLSFSLFDKYGDFYSFRDFLNTSQKGRNYIIKYYALGRLIGSGEVNLSLSTMIKCANMAISQTRKLDKLVNNQSYTNDILYDKAEGDAYRELLYELKSASTKTRWNTIINELITDVNQYQDKTVGDIVQTF